MHKIPITTIRRINYVSKCEKYIKDLKFSNNQNKVNCYNLTRIDRNTETDNILDNRVIRYLNIKLESQELANKHNNQNNNTSKVVETLNNETEDKDIDAIEESLEVKNANEDVLIENRDNEFSSSNKIEKEMVPIVIRSDHINCLYNYVKDFLKTTHY